MASSASEAARSEVEAVATRRYPIAHWLLLGFWMAGLLAAIVSGFMPDPYLEHVRRLAPPHPYPLRSVLVVSVLMTFQVAVLAVLLKPGVSWRRAAAALVVCLLFLPGAIAISLHAPPPIDIWFYWLVAATSIALVVLLATAWKALRAR